MPDADVSFTTVGPKAATVPVTCQSGATVTGCTVVIRAFVDGHWVRIGTGTATGDGDVVVTLTDLGQRLVARAGGAVTRVTAQVTTADGTSSSTTGTRLVSRRLRVRPVFFDSDSSTVRPTGRRYLDGLRRKLSGVQHVTCVGYTDSVGSSRYDRALGLRRARAVCRRLTHGLDISFTVRTRGEQRPFATNTTRHGRSLNRRTEIRLRY